MRPLAIGAAMLVVAGLFGCEEPQLESSTHHGRYVGIGIYNPGTQWTKIVGADAPNVTPKARTIDDQAIIVVEDSDTGEIRACGDLTGYCIGMNPWAHALSSSQNLPVSLTEHEAPPKPLNSSAAK